MAFPAVGFDRGIIVTLIAELCFVCVTFHAVELQAFWIGFALNNYRSDITLPDDLISPSIEQLHMHGPHFCSRQHAGLCIGWQNEFGGGSG